MDPRIVRWFVWSVAALPLAWFGLFWLYVLRARLALGVWPQPYQPDPKDLGFGLHHDLIALAMPLVLVTPMALAIWALLFRRWLHEAGVRPWLAPSVGLALSAAMLALVYLDPGHFVAWYFD
jgi:ABC-type dipeptide/oligopeptide/nickel transport system permease component